MTAPLAQVVIKQTALADGDAAVVTTRMLKAHCLRPYVTYAVNENGDAADLASFGSTATAQEREAPN